MVLAGYAASMSATDERVILDNSPKLRFTWGADVGASIDMSGDDMSTLDVNVAFGMSRKWINFLGVGAEADIMVNNSCRSFPMFVQFRTNFRNRPSIVFWDVKGGVALNYLEHNHQQTGAYVSTGIGFYLARSDKFSSHLIIGYTFKERRPVYGELTHEFKDLHYAGVRIGVVF